MSRFFRVIRAMFVLGLVGTASAFAVAYYKLPEPAWRGTMCMVSTWTHLDDDKFGQCLMAIKEDMTYVSLNAPRAHAFARAGRHSEAIIDYTRVVLRSPLSAREFYNRGQAYMALNNWQMAIADFTSALAIRSRLPEYNARGAAYYNLKEYDRAIADLTKVLDSEPVNLVALTNRGLALYGARRYQPAIIDFTRAIELEPQEGRPYAMRGLSHLALKDKRRAQIDFEAALARPNQNSSHTLARQGLASL